MVKPLSWSKFFFGNVFTSQKYWVDWLGGNIYVHKYVWYIHIYVWYLLAKFIKLSLYAGAWTGGDQDVAVVAALPCHAPNFLIHTFSFYTAAERGGRGEGEGCRRPQCHAPVTFLCMCESVCLSLFVAVVAPTKKGGRKRKKMPYVYIRFFLVPGGRSKNLRNYSLQYR
jgi:hypothetical protein